MVEDLLYSCVPLEAVQLINTDADDPVERAVQVWLVELEEASKRCRCHRTVRQKSLQNTHEVLNPIFARKAELEQCRERWRSPALILPIFLTIDTCTSSALFPAFSTCYSQTTSQLCQEVASAIKSRWKLSERAQALSASLDWLYNVPNHSTRSFRATKTRRSNSTLSLQLLST